MVARKSNLFDRITENNEKTIKTPFGKMQVVDEFIIQDNDKVSFCQKAREKYNEFDKMFNEFIKLDKRIGHKVSKALDESTLKENECSLEQLLSKAYVSEYRMVSKNSAIVRVRTSPALLTSDSMAARFTEDIPDGYELEVEYLGEDPVLGRNFDIYEVQLLKN